MSFNAEPAVKALVAWFKPEMGLYHWDDPSVPGAIYGAASLDPGKNIVERYEDTERWWNSANATGALIDYAAITGDTSFHAIIAITFNEAPKTWTISDPSAALAQIEDDGLAGGAAGFLVAGPAGALVGLVGGAIVGAAADAHIDIHADIPNVHFDIPPPHVDVSGVHIDVHAHIDVPGVHVDVPGVHIDVHL